MINKIVDRIFIGNINDARNRFLLKENKITAILTLCHSDVNLPIIDEKWYEFNYYKYPLLDGQGNKTFDFICAAHILKKLVEEEQTVLVHCFGGISRSTFIVALYLASESYKPLDDAYDEAMELITKVRPQAQPCEYFEKVVLDHLNFWPWKGMI